MNELKEIKIKVTGGYLRAIESGDPEYPGIWVEFVGDDDNGENLSRPQALMEIDPSTNKPRLLVWDDPNNEDYTQEIKFKEERK
jgi:hypothetical protein